MVGECSRNRVNGTLQSCWWRLTRPIGQWECRISGYYRHAGEDWQDPSANAASTGKFWWECGCLNHLKVSSSSFHGLLLWFKSRRGTQRLCNWECRPNQVIKINITSAVQTQYPEKHTAHNTVHAGHRRQSSTQLQGLADIPKIRVFSILLQAVVMDGEAWMKNVFFNSANVINRERLKNVPDQRRIERVDNN